MRTKRTWSAVARWETGGVLAVTLVLAVGCATGESIDPGGGSGGAKGTGGTPGASGGAVGNGSGGAVGNGSGGAVASTGGIAPTASGGSVGSGGAPPGTGGTTPTTTGGTVGSGGTRTGGSSGTTTGSGGISALPSLKDDFEAIAVGTSPKTWIADPAVTGESGMWGVVADGANHVYQEQTQFSSLSLAVGGNVNWTDFKLETKVKVVSSTSTSSARITLAVRYQDPKNYLLLELTMDGKIKLRARNDSSSTDIATNDSKTRSPLTVGAWNTVGISVSGPASGPTVTAHLNGAPVSFSSLTPVMGPAAGGIALGVTAAVVSFDDVTVTSP
jgi:hypothetical protein